LSESSLTTIIVELNAVATPRYAAGSPRKPSAIAAAQPSSAQPTTCTVPSTAETFPDLIRCLTSISRPTMKSRNARPSSEICSMDFCSLTRPSPGGPMSRPAPM
jgi:hypothetical protein